jgi:hypothetical protein
MILKSLAIVAVLLAIQPVPVAASGQASNHADVNRQTPPVAPSPGTAPKAAAVPAERTDCESGPCDYQPAHITVATPAPAPAPAQWPLRDRIAWAANLVLAVLGYAGILLALSTLRKIERQTRYGEAAATAAAESAQAALLHAQAILHAERPWILISVERARSIENGFTVIATNRGRSPARIVATVDETRFAVDEAHLPATPEYKPETADAPFAPIILLPGESADIKPFCRDEVKALCASEARLRRVENWEERIFIYGKVIYRDLIAPASEQIHETDWCCWYIHGRQKSGMVMAPSPEYNLHN